MSMLCYGATWYAFLYRSYTSFKILKHEANLTDQQRAARVREAVQFWVVFALLSLFDVYVEFMISWFPLYWYVKLGMLLWIANPHSNGAIVAFERLVQPRMLIHAQWIDKHVTPVLGKLASITGYFSAHLLLQNEAGLAALSHDELEALSRSTSAALLAKRGTTQHARLRLSSSDEDYVYVQSATTSLSSSTSPPPPLLPSPPVVLLPSPAAGKFQHPMYYPFRRAATSPQRPSPTMARHESAPPAVYHDTDVPLSSSTKKKSPKKTQSAPKTININRSEEPVNHAVFDEDYHRPVRVTSPLPATFNQSINSSADEVLELFDSPLKSDRKAPSAPVPPQVPSRDREPLVSPVFSSSSSTTRRLSWLSPRWPFFQDSPLHAPASFTPERDQEPISSPPLPRLESLSEKHVPVTSATTMMDETPPPLLYVDVTDDATEENIEPVVATTTTRFTTRKRDGPVTRAMARRAAKKG